MSDFKALTSESGKFQGGGAEENGIPESPSRNAFFSSWMRRLGGANRRRGSVGFNEQADIPPNRFDEDSNSSQESPRDSGWTLSFSKKRNESYSELTGMTPGEDCDTYFYKNKFNRTDSEANMRDVVQSNNEGVSKMETTPNPSLGLQTLKEGKLLALTERNEASSSLQTSSSSPRKNELESGSSIFLIDFEEIESESGKKILKPSGKKFSASSLLQSKFAQSWFFRNADNEENDSLVEKEPDTEEKRKHSKDEKQKISDGEDFEESGKDDKKPLLSKIRSVVEKQSKQSNKHREMNLWQPQGT